MPPTSPDPWLLFMGISAVFLNFQCKKDSLSTLAASLVGYNHRQKATELKGTELITWRNNVHSCSSPILGSIIDRFGMKLAAPLHFWTHYMMPGKPATVWATINM
jgi:hypothetical protein